MKKVIVVLGMLLLILTSCGKEKKERIEDKSKLEIRNEKFYVIGENKPYTGTFISKHENGNLWEEEKYKDGLHHGEFKTYFTNGQLILLNVYKDGNLDGPHKAYYENGNLRIEGTYKNGNLEGILRMYYENGQLWSESIYENDEEMTPTKWYDENGNPKPSLEEIERNGL